MEAAGARIRVGSLPVVLADRSNLCRVFQNLIGNAVKFTRGENPEVTIAAEREGAMWRIEVRDNGIGMDPESARRIFEPFRRLHGEEDYPGTGIGLAVCERIVEQHGGRIWVTSAPARAASSPSRCPRPSLRRRRRLARTAASRREDDARRRRGRRAARGAGARWRAAARRQKGRPPKEPLRIGTKNFTESEIFGELYKQALESRGIPVTLQSQIGSTEVINQALRDGSLDMYPEYVGVLLSEVDDVSERPARRRRPTHWRSGSRSSASSRCSTRHPRATKTRSPSQKAFGASATDREHPRPQAAPRATLKAAPEFGGRVEGMVGLRKVYGLTKLRLRRGARRASSTPSSTAARSTSRSVFTTDSQLAGGDYTVLKDPKGVFDDQQVAPVICRRR